MFKIRIPNGVYIRFFLWVWNANPERLDICKLFWGTTLLPLGFLFRLGDKGFLYLVAIGVSLWRGEWIFSLLILLLAVIESLLLTWKAKLPTERDEPRRLEHLSQQASKVISKPFGVGGRLVKLILSPLVLGLIRAIFTPITKLLIWVNGRIKVRLPKTLRVPIILRIGWEYLKAFKQRTCIPVEIVYKETA